MNKKFTGSTTAAISMFLISGVFAGILGVRQVERVTTHEVLGVAGDWTAGVRIEPKMLQKVRVDKQISGIKNPSYLIGKQLKNDKRNGEIFRAGEAQSPPRSWLAQQIPEGMVLYTMRPQAGAIPHSQLRNGDLFDVLATGPAGVRTLARGVRLVGAMGGQSGAAQSGGALGAANKSQPSAGVSMVVAIKPEYVYPLASIRSTDVVSIVLHSSENGAANTASRIDPKPTHRTIEILSGFDKRSIAVPMTK